MDRDEGLDAERRARSRTFRIALGAGAAGLIMVAVGFTFGLAAEGDGATGFGVVAGAGVILTLAGALLAWSHRPGDTRWITEGAPSRRDRMQTQRNRRLFLFPAVGLLFLVLAVEPTRIVMSGDPDIADWLRLSLPVLYAWISACIVLGWDGQSRKHRKYLEDELTAVLRARAMTAAFVVLMAGATVALVVGLVRPEYGVFGAMAAITAGGATAGIRFAWLDREAGRDG